METVECQIRKELGRSYCSHADDVGNPCGGKIVKSHTVQKEGDLRALARDGSPRDKLGLITANGTTPYIVGFVNLARTGPLVVDYPTAETAGGCGDFWQRSIVNFGLTGPDEGKGGRYLILGPGQDAPKGFTADRVVRSPTFTKE